MAASIVRKPGYRLFALSKGCRHIRSMAPQVTQSPSFDESASERVSCVDEIAVQANPIDDMPISDLHNPYEKERRLCLLCKHPVKLDYKNPKLLSQFVSQFTGQIYGKHITGLCKEQQRRLEKAIAQARDAGYMAAEYKDVRYLKDPKLFDPSNQPVRKH